MITFVLIILTLFATAIGAGIGGGPGALLAFICGLFVIKGVRAEQKKAKDEIKSEIDSLEDKEVECRCEACGHFWCYGQDEIRDTAEANSSKNIRAGMRLNSRYSTAVVASVMDAKKPYEYFDKCPGCGSKRITKNEVELKKEA